jgi:hypothetical protein
VCRCTAFGDTFVVGPSAPALTLGEALAKAKDGDTIAVMEGEYDGQVGVVTQKKLTIQGVGKRPVLRAGGKHAEGKAILVVRGGEVLVDNIEFRGARVPDGNGAGIRFETGKLTVRSCVFHDNEKGLLAGNDPEAELTVVDSQFGSAPQSRGLLPHLLYVGRIAKLTVTGSRFHEGYEGHLVKSRARESDIAYNMILDGPGGEASYEIDLPNGGRARIVGNVVGQSAGTQNRVLIAYGAEGNAWPESSLVVAHNTLLNAGVVPGFFVRVWDDRLPKNLQVQVLNNVGAGLGLYSLGDTAVFEGNGRTLGRWLRGPSVLDFALPDDSSLKGTAVDPRRAGGQDLSPKAEFLPPIGIRTLQPPARWSPGAFQ